MSLLSIMDVRASYRHLFARRRHRHSTLLNRTRAAWMALLALALACGQRHGTEDQRFAPPGFDIKLLEVLACPENLTSLRLASRAELRTMNAKIRSRTLKEWNGTIRRTPVEAALIREDGRIAYEIREGVPIMLIDDALVLDESVGRPDPAKHRGQ